MRSGFCTLCRGADMERGPMHSRCLMEPCSCAGHDQDVKDKAAALVEEGTEITTVEDVSKWLYETLSPMGAVVNLQYDAGVLSSRLVGMDTITPEDTLRLIYELRKATTILAGLDAALTTQAYLAGEHGDLRIEGLPVAKVTRGRDRKSWDGRGMARAIIDTRMEQRAGEPLDDPWDVAEWLLEVLGIGYGRVTALKALGLDPAHFCESSPGKVSVQFVE